MSERPESSRGTQTDFAGAPTAAPNSLLDTLAGWQPSAGTSFQHASATPSSVSVLCISTIASSALSGSGSSDDESGACEVPSASQHTSKSCSSTQSMIGLGQRRQRCAGSTITSALRGHGSAAKWSKRKARVACILPLSGPAMSASCG